MDELRQLCEWPTIIWAGTITAVFVVLTTLTLVDGFMYPRKKGKR